MQDTIKLDDNRTLVFVEDGRMGEFGGDSPKFQRSASDTWAILHLLKAHEDEIKAAYEREQARRKTGML